MYYVGCHQTENLNDGYLGSGKRLKRAIKKYGVENFKFEILHSVNSKEEMFRLERNIVNESLIKDPLSYNLKIGGSGGNPGIVGAFRGRKHTEQTKEKIRTASLKQITTDNKRKKLSENNGMKNKNVSSRVSEKLKGRICSDDHRKKVAMANIGKILINNGIIAKRILAEDLVLYSDTGWIKGGLPRKKSR